jgi:hypothetical protein
MLLQDKQTGNLIEIEDITSLINPAKTTISGSIQEGQEEQPPEDLEKVSLVFPSGEDLPRCWIDANYRIAN